MDGESGEEKDAMD